MSRTFNQLAERKNLPLGLALVVAAVLAILTFFSIRQQGSMIILPDNGRTPSLNIEVLSLDHMRNTVSFRLTVRGGSGRKILPVDVQISAFVNRSGPVSRYTLVSSGWRRVALAELDTIQLTGGTPIGYLPRQPGSDYEANLSVPLPVETKWFPLDKFAFGITGREPPSAGRQSTAGLNYTLRVQNLLKDFTVRPSAAPVRYDTTGGVSVDESALYLRFGRKAAIQWLALGILVVAALTAVVITQRASSRDVDFSFLTLLAGIWAARAMLMGQLEDAKPFPSLVDAGVVFLFALSAIGVFTATRLRESRLQAQSNAHKINGSLVIQLSDGDEVRRHEVRLEDI
jgi:hypothetical protein